MTTRVRVCATIFSGLVLAGGLLAWLASEGEATPPDGAPVQLAPRVSATAARTTSATPDDTLDRIVRTVDDPAVLGAKLGSPPSSASLVELASPTDPGAPIAGQSLYITVRAPDRGGDAVRAIWLGNVIGGALNEQLRALGMGELNSIELIQRSPDGFETPIGGGIGNMVVGQVFDPVDLAAIKTSASSVMTVLSIRVIPTTFQDAIEVVGQVSDPRALLEAISPDALLQQVFGDVRRYEGFYLEIRDAKNDAFIKLAGANRGGVGQTWIAPQFLNRVGELGLVGG